MSLQQTTSPPTDGFSRRPPASLLCLVMIVFALTQALVADAASAQPTSPEARQGAAEAYDKGVGAYLSGRYEDAAGWFETAHRLSPAAAALQQAVRARLRGTDLARAASLAHELREHYPNHEKARAYADGVLNQLADQLVQIEVLCDGCKITLDGLVLASQTFFVSPGGSHTVSGSFDSGVAKHEFTAGPPGTVTQVPLEAPARSVVLARQSLSVSSGSGTALQGLSPIYVYIGAGFTGALLAATLVSGIGANARGDSYNHAANAWEGAGCPAEPLSAQSDDCQRLYDAARRRLDTAEGSETRTNVLLGATLVGGVATAALAYFFTDWDDQEAATPAMTVSYGDRSAAVHLRMAF